MSSSPHSFTVHVPLDLLVLLNKECAENDQLPSTFILRLLTEHFKDKLTIDVYEYLIYQYSMTALEQRERKRQKAKQPKQDAHEKKLREEIAHYEAALRERENAYIRTKLERSKEELRSYQETKMKT
jgi:hypothetical protein